MQSVMPVEKKFCFKSPDGEDVFLFTLTNKNGTEVSITNYGAIITSFKIKTSNGSFNDIVLGFDDVKDYLSEHYLTHYAYLGAACGRYANRIKNGRFVLDGNEYQLSQNMSEDQLHGGHEGFDRKTWQVISQNGSTDPSLELKYMSKDGEEGFPGNLDTVIKFELNDDDELIYEYSAKTDRPTAINLTHHSYFNLNDGQGIIDEHEIRIPASAILKQDEGLVCDGGYVPVQNTKYDFSAFKAINQDWNNANGYDQCFIIDDKTDDVSLVAEAISKRSGITLQIFSTEPAVQFYTAQGMGNLKGKSGTIYGPFSGFCLETHKHPNAINISHFPNTILRPGEKYYQKNIYKVIQEDPK